MPQTSAANSKRSRDGEPLALQGLKARHREAWPTEEQINKFKTQIDSESKQQGTDGKSSTAGQRDFARFIYRFHDTYHAAKLEWWYISGHAGTHKATNTSYSFFAAFFRLHMVADQYAYAVTWALTEAPALATTTATGNQNLSLPPLPTFTPGSAMNTGKYHTFAYQDPLTPYVIDELIRSGKFKLEPRIAAQMSTIAKAGILPSPDECFTVPATCRGSPSSDETLHIEMAGNSFTAHMPQGADAPTYTLKLSGKTRRGDGRPETTASLDMTFTPQVASGFGPVLQGVDGVVSVENFEDDMFYYFSPQCKCSPGTTTLTVDATVVALETKEGEDSRIWVDHEFGGAPAMTTDEALALEARGASDYNWDWGAFHVPGLASISVAVVREENPAIPPIIWAAIQPEYTNGSNSAIAPAFSVFSDKSKPQNDPSQPIRMVTDESVPSYNSPETAMIFPTSFVINIPSLKNLTMRTVSAIPQQEFINLMAKPAFLEGRANIDAKWTEADGTKKQVTTGLGFIEARGKLNTPQIDQIAMITHATLFGPVEMQPAPPVASLPMLPAALVPQITPMLTMMLGLAQPKPKPSHINFIIATVATYSSLCHYGGSSETEAKRLLQWWIGVKKSFLTSTIPTERAGVKEIGIACLMQKELESIIGRKVAPVTAAVAAGVADAALHFIFAVETELASATATAPPAPPGAASAAAPKIDLSSIIAMAAAAGVNIPPQLAADPAALLAMAKAAGLPIPPEIAAALASPAMPVPSPVKAAPTNTTPTPKIDLSSIIAMAAAAGVNIPPQLAADPAALLAMAKAAGLPIPAGIEAALSAVTSAPPTVPAAAPKIDLSSIIAMAAAAGVTIPPQLAADPAALLAIAKATGLPIPPEILAAFAPSGASTPLAAPSNRGFVSNTIAIPTEALLATPSTFAERENARRNMNGHWAYCNSLCVDSVSEYLAHQNVNLAIRMLSMTFKPSMDSEVTEIDGGKTITKVHIMMGTQEFSSLINGKEYNFEAAGRGTLKARACLMAGGQTIAQRFQTNLGIEYKFIEVMTLDDIQTFGLKSGQSLPDGVSLSRPVSRETTVFFTQAQVDEASKHNGVYQSKPQGMLQAYYLKKE